MKLTKSIFLSLAFASATLFVSCGEKKEEAGSPSDGEDVAMADAAVDTPDTLTDELIVQMNRLGDTLLTVKDKASAEVAVKEVTAVGNDIISIAERMDKLETPSEEAQAALEAKMKKTEVAMTEKMRGLGEVMQQPGVAEVLMPAMMEFSKRIQEADKTFERFGKTQ